MMNTHTTDPRLVRAVRLAFCLVFTLLAVVVLAAPVVSYAQGGEESQPGREVTDDEVNAISHELYCPVCENVPLDVCGTEACARWRAQVRTLLEDGASQEDVIDYFVMQFGDRVVGTPQDPTLNLLSWAVPLAGVIVGAAIVAVVLVRWRLGGAAMVEVELHDDESGENDEYRARLERELESLE